MSKTLVIAEKPSVGRDLSKVLPGPFTKGEGVLEGPQHIITWAVGHLVQLADPDEYDEKYAKWRMPDLPIVPSKFKLVVRDERSKKQMTVVKRELDRDDVAEVVNACDAGREGELIFAYLYEKAGSKLPVQRLWLNSMTNSAIKDAFASLRPSEEYHTLEEAARSRSEADWIVGMNATRAATIRLRSSFDGAVSLGRVQTPTLAILARREQEIRDFQPEPYWVVDARFLALPEDPRRAYDGRFHAGAKPRIATEKQANEIVAACEGNTGTITKVEKRESKDRAPLLYDLTSLQRDASSRFGFTARRTLGAAQRLYEEHKALTYPRTNSRYITSDMIPEIKPIAELVGGRKEYAAASKYVTGLDMLPLGRVVNNEKVTDHHAIIPTLAERHPVDKMESDDLRIYDLVVRRFLAVFHPEAVFENTRIETTVADYIFRTRGKLLVVPGWRGVYGEAVTADANAGNQDEEDEGADQQLPKLEQGEQAQVHRVAQTAKETKPPRRYSDGSLLDAMETAGKLSMTRRCARR
jgi:DNA topoisomerase-3